MGRLVQFVSFGSSLAEPISAKPFCVLSRESRERVNRSHKKYQPAAASSVNVKPLSVDSGLDKYYSFKSFYFSLPFFHETS